MFINDNIPYFKAYVRKEYVHNFEKGHGEFLEAWVFGATAMEGRVLSFSVLLDNGAQWARLPIQAIVFKKDAPIVPLRFIQPWDCASYHLSVIKYNYLRNMPVKVLMADGSIVRGHYMFTVDYAIDQFGENDEHKCTHLIQAENGLLLGQPNNRCLWADAILTKPHEFPKDLKSCYNTSNWSSESDFEYLENPKRILNPLNDKKEKE
jgi:hypothetical protein